MRSIIHADWKLVHLRGRLLVSSNATFIWRITKNRTKHFFLSRHLFLCICLVLNVSTKTFLILDQSMLQCHNIYLWSYFFPSRCEYRNTLLMFHCSWAIQCSSIQSRLLVASSHKLFSYSYSDHAIDLIAHYHRNIYNTYWIKLYVPSDHLWIWWLTVAICCVWVF